MRSPYVSIREKQVFLIMVVLAVLFTLLYSVTAQAQEFAMNSKMSYLPENPTLIYDKVEKEFAITAVAVSMNNSVNTPFIELKPTLTPDGKRMYFSRLPYQASISGNKYNEDIWFADFNAQANTWSGATRLPGELNNAGPNFVNNISSSGDTLILGNQYLKKGKMVAGLSYSVNENGTWSAPKTIKIKNDYNISEHANHFVSFESNVIISAIERSETLGERDLYISFWNGNAATEPVNMGTRINTALEESSPFLSDDGKTLFFASKGHNGYGGFDIFMTTRLDESWTNWSEPKNLGPAVNTVRDDEHFSITHCKNYAMFSRQVDINNVDLFTISISELALQNATTVPPSISNALGSF